MLDRVAYHGFPGGRPKWHFDLPSKPKPEPVTVPTGLHELAILRLLAGGSSDQDIARSLHLAEGTVKSSIASILDQLGSRDRTRAVLKAINLRII